MKYGDFSTLAVNYSKFRQGYSASILKNLDSLLYQKKNKLDLVDVGAGTGIWTRMLMNLKPTTITAIEPNDAMRSIGIKDSSHMNIKWNKGTGESTGLPDCSADMVSMASSFHWVNFEVGCKEFHRILKDQGIFVALWNPRFLEATPLLQEIENFLFTLKPDLCRISSGVSRFTENLTDKFYETNLFADVLYFEDFHSVYLTPNQYIGAWRSTNDIPAELGDEKFEVFIAYMEAKLAHLSEIEVVYRTRAWCVRKI